MTMVICGIFKNGTNEPIYKAEIEAQMQKINIITEGGKKEGWGKLQDQD